METAIKSHDTIVCGFINGKVVFCKTFDHETEERQMREAIKYVTENYSAWLASDIKYVTIDND